MKNHTVMKMGDLELMCNHMDESHKHIVVLKKQDAKKIHKCDSNCVIQKQPKLNYIAWGNIPKW